MKFSDPLNLIYNQGMIDLIAFDADDTLWYNEYLYVEARLKFADILRPYGVDLTELERLVHATEIGNLPYYGFGISSFTLSLIEAAVAATGGRLTGGDVGRLLAVSRGMVTADVRLIDGVEEALTALAGEYPLLVITKGDLLHQQSKVSRSGLGGYFAAVEVVSDKTADVYREILTRHNVAPERFVMIGNSLRSDILPVASLGGRAIHVPNGTSWAYDLVDLPDDLPGPVFHSEHLAGAVALIRRGLRL